MFLLCINELIWSFLLLYSVLVYNKYKVFFKKVKILDWYRRAGGSHLSIKVIQLVFCLENIFMFLYTVNIVDFTNIRQIV